MNDNQYIAHSSNVICHYGVKGMKWKQHLKGIGKYIDENITGHSARQQEKAWGKAANAADSMRSSYSAIARSYQAEADKQDYEKQVWNDMQNSAAKGMANAQIALNKANDNISKMNSSTSVSDRAYQGRLKRDAEKSLRDETNKYYTYADKSASTNSNSESRKLANEYNVRAWQEQQKYNQANSKRYAAQQKANKSLFGRARLIFGKPKSPGKR